MKHNQLQTLTFNIILFGLTFGTVTLVLTKLSIIAGLFIAAYVVLKAT